MDRSAMTEPYRDLHNSYTLTPQPYLNGIEPFRRRCWCLYRPRGPYFMTSMRAVGIVDRVWICLNLLLIVHRRRGC